MPQITNTTSADIWLPQLGVTVPANEFVNSDVYPVLNQSGQAGNALVIPAGLTINTAFQAYDPILYAQVITANTTVQLPATIVPRTSYTVKILCTAGTVAVRFNSTLNTLFTIPATDTFQITVQSRTIDTIYFYVDSGTAYLTVRKA